MRRTLTTTLAALALALAACGDDDNGGGDEGAKTTDEGSQAGQKYPEEVRNNFLTSCDEQPNAPRSVCECSLEEIEAKYSLEEFKKIDAAQRKGEPLPDDIQAIVEDCVEQES